MKYLTRLVIMIIVLSGCSTLTIRERKRIDVLDCIKMIKEQDDSAGIADVYEVCRQLYGINKVADKAVK